ncbi:hypothetical protein N7470_007506 [Penicillium chermesinum]|nr:hypothetical protein N7470_007506 [Penicillium chermesinum]
MDQKGPVQDDDAQLAAMGHRPELKRQFSTWAMLGLAFAVLNVRDQNFPNIPSSQYLQLTDTVLDCSFSELVNQFNIWGQHECHLGAGGQYHWVAVISWPRWVPILSWITGWINVAGWVALVATNSLLSSQLIVGIISAMHPSYEPQRWQQFLIYIGLTLGAFVINAFMNSILPIIYRGAFTWSIGGFAIVCITVLACASPDFNSAYFVFAKFVNETGWPDGVAWLLGVRSAPRGYALSLTIMTALARWPWSHCIVIQDAVAHMIEEVPNPSIEGPKIMVSCVGIGTFTGCVFLIVLLFVAGDMNTVTTSAAGPLLQILIDATKNKAGAICLLMLPIVCLIMAILSVMTTSSRMIYAFARDGGLPASKFFATVHPTLQLPLNALVLTVVVDGTRSRSEDGNYPPPSGGFAILMQISLSYIALTTVLFVFPPSSTVTGSSMNYCIAAFAVIIIISVFQWIVDGRKNFTGPRIDLGVDGAEVIPAGHDHDYEK